MITLTINGKRQAIDLPPDTPLLWALRDYFGLTGTKYGCGIAQCGACTVHLDGKRTLACITPNSSATGKAIVTIEAIGEDPTGNAVQEAWLALGVPQCGYCQPGQVMAATALLKQFPRPGDEEIDAAMSGNICRCGTYPRIRAAIKQVAGHTGHGTGTTTVFSSPRSIQDPATKGRSSFPSTSGKVATEATLAKMGGQS